MRWEVGVIQRDVGLPCLQGGPDPWKLRPSNSFQDAAMASDGHRLHIREKVPQRAQGSLDPLILRAVDQDPASRLKDGGRRVEAHGELIPPAGETESHSSEGATGRPGVPALTAGDASAPGTHRQSR